MAKRTLAERFPIGKSVTTKNIVVGSTRSGIVTNYINDYPGTEFIVVEFPRGLAALPPEELQRNDLQHPACPSCQCEMKSTRLAPRRAPRLLTPEEKVELEKEDEDD